MLSQLPPAGDAVRLWPAAADGVPLEREFSPYRVRYYQSGTAALAAALMAAASRHPKHAAEVLLPAYGCPDLISAALYAGLRPVLVDLEPDRPWISLPELEARINEHTVAVVAVSLLGIPERMRALRSLARAAGIVLIEDSAQAIPHRLQGDYAVLSFGRGKPVSMLGGGAVLAADEPLQRLLPEPEPASGPVAGFYMKAAAYNLLRHPGWYWLPQRLPGLNLGRTRFRSLRELRALDPVRRARISASLASYRRHHPAAQDWLEGMIEQLGDRRLCPLETASRCGERPRLLRYPLLFGSAQLRDAAYEALSAAGLGASVLYERSLPSIDGVAQHLHRAASYPCADDFASRLLTLPTHSGVRKQHVQRMKTVLRAVLAQRCTVDPVSSIRTREGET